MSSPSFDPKSPAFEREFKEQLAQALREPTLLQAMTYVCICEGTRIAKQITDPRLPVFDSCFSYILERVRAAWIDAGKPLTEFQPNFLPPNPPH